MLTLETIATGLDCTKQDSLSWTIPDVTIYADIYFVILAFSHLRAVVFHTDPVLCSSNSPWEETCPQPSGPLASPLPLLLA